MSDVWCCQKLFSSFLVTGLCFCISDSLILKRSMIEENINQTQQTKSRTSFPHCFGLLEAETWKSVWSAALSLVLQVVNTDGTFGAHVGWLTLSSLLSLSAILMLNPYSHSAAQEQPWRSAPRLYSRQEVAWPAVCNSTWDFVWVTYIMAPFIFYCNSNRPFFFFLFFSSFLFLTDF